MFRPHPEVAASSKPGEVVGEDDGVNVGTNVGVNVGAAPGLNERQTWFLARVETRERIRAADIAERFSVTTRTAERDVAGLSAAGLVAFEGPKKSGRYILKKAGD